MNFCAPIDIWLVCPRRRETERATSLNSASAPETKTRVESLLKALNVLMYQCMYVCTSARL